MYIKSRTDNIQDSCKENEKPQSVKKLYANTYPWQNYLSYLGLTYTKEEINEQIAAIELPIAPPHFTPLKDKYNQAEDLKKFLVENNLDDYEPVNEKAYALFKDSSRRLIMNALILSEFSDKSIIDIFKQQLDIDINAGDIKYYKKWYFNVDVMGYKNWVEFFALQKELGLYQFYVYTGAWHKNKSFVLQKLRLTIDMAMDEYLKNMLNLCHQKIIENVSELAEETAMYWLDRSLSIIDRLKVLNSEDKYYEFVLKVKEEVQKIKTQKQAIQSTQTQQSPKNESTI